MARPLGTRKPLVDRFMNKWTEDTSTGCWVWAATLNNSGYGQIKVHFSKLSSERQHVLAHRVSWQLFRGKIPKGIFVLHKCDNPKCVNPDHLFLGRPKDNIRDCIDKGKFVHGENTYNAKLTFKDVDKIRASDKKNIELAEEYNVSDNHISRIKNFKRWRLYNPNYFIQKQNG